jgi:hypothetical protein
MIWLLSLALLAVASAVVIDLYPGQKYYYGNSAPSDGDYLVDMDVTLKSLDKSKFDVSFALLPCSLGTDYIQSHYKLPESEFDVFFYENARQYTFTKGTSFCYVIQNNNLFLTGTFDFEVNITEQQIDHGTDPLSGKPIWKLVLMICGIVVGVILAIALTWFLVKRYCRTKKDDSYVAMEEPLVDSQN